MQLSSFLSLSLCLLLLSGQLSRAQSSEAKVIIKDTTHFSEVFDESRHYRLILPPDYYEHPNRKYPVIYFFHGYGGRYNGPADGERSVSAEARYYDEFNGNIARTGPDSLDNFAAYVSKHDVIVAKWDGYVANQYPRPYDIGPVKEDKQFIDYFPEFVRYVDAHYRTIPSREGRAVSGLSMGGFMSMFVASKYPHLISSASFFCPSSAFIIGPKALQAYTSFEEMGKNYVGLPIRMHIGAKDFLRQHDLGLDQAFKTLELYYESWHYGVNYFNGFHNTVNIEGQFDFHMKNFRRPIPKPEQWYHIDVYPNFEVWNYVLKSNRTSVGYTLLEAVSQEGFKVQTKQWLPDGPAVPSLSFELTTDGLYAPNTIYQVMRLDVPKQKISKQEVQTDAEGRLRLQWQGDQTDIGIYQQGDSGYISMANYNLDTDMPTAWKEIRLTPLLWNKGGKAVDSIQAELIAQDEDIEVLSSQQTIGNIARGALYQQTSFSLRSRNPKLDRAKLKLVLQYADKKEQFLLEVPFYTPEAELENFAIADGGRFSLEVEGNTLLGKGNADGKANPGEWISILAQSDLDTTYWYGLKLFTTDPYVDWQNRKLKYFSRNDWSGTQRPASELYISPDCPDGHKITLYGIYDFPKAGNIPRDNQGALSFIHETRRVSFTVEVRK
ncbi:alpha/beta hydrolase [Catalinimonas niigatensis]|uniref:alpha/beta hydrolase n=1 Tax=Catalinimonas niigatensis TaxID=1397264 RepID=UPI0026671158|nr:alpha/beta hydrolase-fold protein [Catalinimonas niigatensis]WPP52942.1 alpha/beta hydrolase-fold protein [Catalinimonas niigatensis]